MSVDGAVKWLPTSYSDDPFDRLAVGNAATSGGGHLEVDTHGAVRSPRQRRTFRRGADPSATRSSEIPRPAGRTRQRHHYRRHARQRADGAETADRPAPACDPSARACGTSW
ncbi:hypothetical protein PJP10_15565 [Mycobacterium kansasii]